MGQVPLYIQHQQMLTCSVSHKSVLDTVPVERKDTKDCYPQVYSKIDLNCLRVKAHGI